MSNDERRRDPRIPMDLRGVVDDANGGDEVLCRVANLSRSGAHAVSNRALPEMTQVRIRIQLDADEHPAPATFNCDAAVVRCDRRPDGAFDLGLFFTWIAPSDRAMLEELLKAKPIVTMS